MDTHFCTYRVGGLTGPRTMYMYRFVNTDDTLIIYIYIYILDHSDLHVLFFYAYDVFSICCDKFMMLMYKMLFNVINTNVILGYPCYLLFD
jgi:hypothetical protein